MANQIGWRIGVLVIASGCGTYSLVRPAETMRAGKVELAAGLAVGAIGEVNPIVHGAYAITDDVEINAQTEVWNTFVEGRYGILHERDNGLSLAVGVGGGRAVTLVSLIGDEVDPDDADGGAAGLVSAFVGKRLGPVDLTLGNRTFVQFGGDFFMSSTRLAVRLAIGAHFGLMVEGGGTVHAPIEHADQALFLAEASAGFWFGF
jgi:hypothetical protein